jgi:hypothetical protein
MGRPQVADGEDDLEIWKVAVNILNKVMDNGQGVFIQLGGWTWG